MNKEMKDHIIKSITENTRLDGRKREEYRDVVVEYGISANAEGSARVKLGETEVIAGVKLSVETPYPDTPEDGNLMVSAELKPLASPEFESGPPRIEAIELARVTDRGIRESGMMDTKKLCIERGEKVWMVIIDVMPINDAGNLFDASSLAALAALKDTTFPKYENGEIDYKTKTNKKLELKKEPIGVTVRKVGGNLIVDPTNEEEKVAEARLTVTSDKNGHICAIQKGENIPLSIEEVEEMVELALKKAEELRKKL